MNSDKNYETGFTVNKDPQTVFRAIIDTRKWWSGDIEGGTEQLGDVFTYRYKDLHYSKQKVTELVHGKRVTWDVLEASLNFVEDKTDWATRWPSPSSWPWPGLENSWSGNPSLRC